MNKLLSIKNIETLALRARRSIVTMATNGKSSHVGSALSCVEIIALLYSGIMNITPENWNSPTADRFILSKGHGAKAWYAVLAELGFFQKEKLESYCLDGSRLGEHPSSGSLPGILVSTGSLGHGISVGVGMALAQKMNKNTAHTFVVLSDGECNEGSVWEAAMSAAHHKLDNLIAIIDDNQWQALGPSRDVNALEPFASKWEAFGWRTYMVDGHSVESLTTTLQQALNYSHAPQVIIAHTCLGKGVSFMEDNLLWHYQIPSQEQLQNALKELVLS